MLPHQRQSSSEPHKEYCSSQQLYEKMKKCKQKKHYDKSFPFEIGDKANSLNNVNLSRNKRWLADEVSVVFHFFFFTFCSAANTN